MPALNTCRLFRKITIMRTIEWQFPLQRSHAGIAMGNGLFGALIWGKDRIHVTLNRSDFWDHRGGYRPTEGVTTYKHIKAAYTPDDPVWVAKVFPRPKKTLRPAAPSRLPFGRMELQLRPGFVPVKGELNLNTGTAAVLVAARNSKPKHEVRFDLSVDSSAIWVHDPHHMIRAVKICPAWDWVEEKLRLLKFEKPVILRKPGVWGWAQACPADPALAALCRKVDDGFIIALDRGDGEVQALEAANRLAETIRALGRNHLLSANAGWWRTFWRRAPRLRLPDEFFNRFYQYALFKFGAATNPRCAWPAGLQGPWVEEYQWPPWNADYHFNVNVQQVYTLAPAANQLEHLLPLFDRLDIWRDVMRRNAKVVCGIDDGLILGMCVDDRGKMLYGGAGVVIDHACSGWIAQLFWKYYLYTGDVKFLRDRAFPFMRGVMRVYEAMLEKKAGRLSLAVSISAEFGNDTYPRLMGRDSSWQLACIHMLADALLAAARILKTPPRPAWQTIKKKVPLYTLIGKPGEERIAVWEGQDLTFCHRHHSHLACIYPFDSSGELTPEKNRIIENSIDHWISMGMGKWSEWCMPWAAIIQARMGFKESPWLILQIWRKLFINEGLATVYLPQFRGITEHRKADQKKPRETNEIMQLDGTMGAVTAIYEMLVHTRGEVTHVFPAVPDEWKDVSFAGIRLPGAFFISAARKNSRLQFISIRSLTGGALKIQAEGYATLMLKRKQAKNAPVQLPARLIFKPGETLILKPA